ncbi:MAG TPA: 30S ribosomal protein S7 [Candidatus Norongarragalinales archaeon]|nr:30S ribosomal protein S7 [Candidatus Norongarragalinales archaeon]
MEMKLFGLYEYTNLEIKDLSLAQHISLKPMIYPHSFAKHANIKFAKSKVNIVERLINKLLRGGTGEKMGGKIIRTHGKLQGKKTKAIKMVRNAFAEVQRRTKQNPIQVLIRALENSAPREDTTRVRFGGMSYQIAVDISAQRRLDLALRNIVLAAISAAFDKKLTLEDSLVNEIVLAANNDPASFSVKRKNEIERVARSAR